jgi:hypothetical protein
MSWITLVDQDVLPSGNQERIGIVAAKGIDDLANCVAEAVEAFRSAIASTGNTLGPSGTVPSGFKHYVLGMALWHFVSAGVPQNEALQTPARRDQNSEAEALLRQLRAGRVMVELPDGVTAQYPRTGAWGSENPLVMRTHPVPPPEMQYQPDTVP